MEKEWRRDKKKKRRKKEGKEEEREEHRGYGEEMIFRWITEDTGSVTRILVHVFSFIHSIYKKFKTGVPKLG